MLLFPCEFSVVEVHGVAVDFIFVGLIHVFYNDAVLYRYFIVFYLIRAFKRAEVEHLDFCFSARLELILRKAVRVAPQPLQAVMRAGLVRTSSGKRQKEH